MIDFSEGVTLKTPGGGRIDVVTCLECGSMVRDDQDPLAQHEAWHRSLVWPNTYVWPTVKCALAGCENRLRMRTIGADDEGNGGRPDVDGALGRDDQWCSEGHRAISVKLAKR